MSLNWTFIYLLWQFIHLNSDHTVEINSVLTTEVDFVCYLHRKQDEFSLYIIQFNQNWEHAHVVDYSHTVFTPKYLDQEKVYSIKQWTLLLLTATTNELFQYRSSLESGLHAYWLEGTIYRVDVSISDSSPRHYEDYSESQTLAPFVSLRLRLDFRTENSYWIQFDANSIEFVQLVEHELMPLLPPARKRFDFSFNVSVAENKYLVASGFFILKNEGSYWIEALPSFYFRVFDLKEKYVCFEDSSNMETEGKLAIKYSLEKRVFFKFEKRNNTFVATGSIETLIGPTSDGLITEKNEGVELFFNKYPVLFNPKAKWHFKDFLINRPASHRIVLIKKVQVVKTKFQLRKEFNARIVKFYFPDYCFKLKSLTPIKIDFPLFYTTKKQSLSFGFFRFDMVTLFLDPRNSRVVPVTTIQLKNARMVLYLPIKMKIIQLESFFLVKTDYQFGSFEVHASNYLDINYLAQNTKELSYQAFRKKMKIRKMSFENLLLRFPIVVKMESSSNPLLQTTNFIEVALTSFNELFSISHLYIEKIELVESSDFVKIYEENCLLIARLQTINLNFTFLIQNHFAIVELNGFSEEDALKLRELNIVLSELKLVFEQIKRFYWIDFGIHLEPIVEETNKIMFVLLFNVTCLIGSAIAILSK